MINFLEETLDMLKDCGKPRMMFFGQDVVKTGRLAVLM